MKDVSYTIRIRGLDRASGAIGAEQLRDVVDALLDGAKSALRLAMEGRSSAKGPLPAWLKRSVDLTITGIGSGSTTIGITAPTLDTAAHDEIVQPDLWEMRPAPEDTALSTLLRAFADADAGGDRIDRLDDGVLARMQKFQDIVGAHDVSLDIRAEGRPRERFVVDRATMQTVGELRRTTPSPRAVLVAGECSVIEHPVGAFRLTLASGMRIAGRLDADRTHIEMLRSLWGRPVTIQGTLHFSPNGRPRFIEADIIRLQEAGEEVLADEAQFADVRPGNVQRRESNAGVALKTLWGSWPGSESIEDLLKMLRDEA